jgi:hemerythrin
MKFKASSRLTDGDIDDQHDHIGSLIATLQLAKISGEGAANSDLVLEYLMRCLHVHFVAEETLMEKSAYPHIGAHRREHAQLIDKLLQLRVSIESGEIELLACVPIIQGWHDDHMLRFDRLYEAWRDADS